MPQVQDLQKAEALRQAISRSTLCLLQIFIWMYVQSNLPKHLPNAGLESSQLVLLDERAHQTKQGFKVLH